VMIRDEMMIMTSREIGAVYTESYLQFSWESRAAAFNREKL